jgi:hypothetical protein
MGWYKTGSANLVQGNPLVVGVGTDFIANVNPGGIFCGPDGKIYEVDFITSATALSLARGYTGATVNGAAFAIAPTQAYIVELAKQATTLLNTFSTMRDDYLAGNLVGAGLQLKGILDDPAQLPAGAVEGDAYLIGGSIYVWAKTRWEHGSIVGPKGDVGDVNPGNIAAAASALDSKTKAATSADQAQASATASAGSATAAAASATAAHASELMAGQSLTVANTARDNAAASATSASGSATVATNAATSVTAALAGFRAVFLGELASDPLVDGNGQALIHGAEYFNTIEQKLRIYTENGWQDYDSTAQIATQNAVLSASNAASSASFAATSATTASTAATEAAGSEARAATSAATASSGATTATTQAGVATAKAAAASISETNAATSAASASTSAASATGSAATASTNAATAVAKADVAIERATAAAGSASAAASSASSAAGFAGSARTSADSAAVSEENAASSHQIATSAASVATDKADAAAASAAAAEFAATQATAGGKVLSVAGREGVIVLTTKDLVDYIDPVAMALALGN